MGKFADLKIGGSTAIDLSDDGLRRGVAEVIEPGFDGNLGVGFGEIAEAEEIGVGGWIDPDGGFQFGRAAGSLGRIEDGAGDFQNAAELEGAADDLGEEGGGGFGGVRARSYIPDRYTVPA